MTIQAKATGTHNVSTAYALSQYYTHTQIAAAYVAQVLAALMA